MEPRGLNLALSGSPWRVEGDGSGRIMERKERGPSALFRGLRPRYSQDGINNQLPLKIKM